MTLWHRFALALLGSATTIAAIQAAEPAPAVQPSDLPPAPAPVQYTFGLLRSTPATSAMNQARAWLTQIGKYDEARFQAIWNQAERSVLDRTIDSIVMGNDAAKQIWNDASRADVAPPKQLPAILKDETVPVFVRSNIALGYARLLTGYRVYEEALEALNQAKPELVVDPSAYYFHKAVTEHALMKKDEAMNSINRLIDDVGDAPERYRMVAALMYVDMQGWKKDEKDLSNIGRIMDNVERRLDLARGGKITQDLQKKIVFRLDELIKEKENQAKGAGQANGGSCPSGGPPNGQQPGNTTNPSAPMQDSQIGGGSGQGKVNEQVIRNLAQKWGELPEHERARALSEVTRDMPPKFRVVIEDYFKSLSRSAQP